MIWKSGGGNFHFYKAGKRIVSRHVKGKVATKNAFAIKVLWRARNVKEEKFLSTDCFFNLWKEKSWRSFKRIAGSWKGKVRVKVESHWKVCPTRGNSSISFQFLSTKENVRKSYWEKRGKFLTQNFPNFHLSSRAAITMNSDWI